MARPSLLQLFAGVALYVGALACAQPDEPTEPPHVLLIVVDTLRQDHLGAYGFDRFPVSPNIDALAAESIVVDGLTACTSWTMPSMATLYTGLTPAQHRVSRMVGPGRELKERGTLATQFRNAGYATACVMSNFLLRAGHGFNEGFDRYDDQPARYADPHRGSTAAEVAQRGIDWTRNQQVANPDQACFLNLHFFDPHTSYEDHKEWQFTDANYVGWVAGGLDDVDYKAEQATATAADRAQLQALYCEEIRAVDQAIGRVIDTLKELGMWENTLVVFTSDHGEELAERGYIGHTRTLHFEQVDLPLIVRMPAKDQVIARVQAPIAQEQLFATTLQLAGIPVPAERGQSVADLLRAAESLRTGGDRVDEPRFLFSEVDFQPVKPDPERRIRLRAVQGFDQAGVRAEKYVRNLKTEQEFFWVDANETQNALNDPSFSARLAEFRAAFDSFEWYQH